MNKIKSSFVNGLKWETFWNLQDPYYKDSIENILMRVIVLKTMTRKMEIGHENREYPSFSFVKV